MKILLLDGMNLIHRSRNSFSKGDHALTYSFFRSFKPLIEKFKADRAYFVLEGQPHHRSETYADYKSNRPSQPDSFWRQQIEILEVMKSLPVIQIRHPDHECDDVIANLAKFHSQLGNEVVIISSDSDFIQLFDSLDPDKIFLYHPIKKEFISKPDYVYLDWKSLRGDVSDNIPGLKGVGDKTASKILSDPRLMKEILEDPDKRAIFERNKSLIRFHWFDDLTDDLLSEGAEVAYPTFSLAAVREEFERMDFTTLLTERYWGKFEDAFETLSAGEN